MAPIRPTVPELAVTKPSLGMRSGDWLLIYHQPEIQFDISRQLLRWPTGSTTSAELKLIGPDGVLFRLR